MQISRRPIVFLAVLALVAGSTLALSGAFAGEQEMPAEPPATKTTSPIHSMMGWVASNVCGDIESPCPSCPKAEKAWRAWFAGGEDVKLAGLRDRLVADGWNADAYVGYFQAMAKAAKKSCGDCDGKDCGDCDGKDCGDCPNRGKCHKGGKGGCCGECPNSKKAEPEPETSDTAAK